ncbi:MAG: hypothetical protein V2A54_12245 [Bacteroidota bacterium]
MIKKLLLVILFFILFFNAKSQGLNDSIKSTISQLRIDFGCQEVDGSSFTIFSFPFYKDPISLFKKTYPEILNGDKANFAKTWNNWLNTESNFEGKMQRNGCLFVGKYSGKKWLVTTAILKDNKIYFWVSESEFLIGNIKNLEWNCLNSYKM